MTEQNVPVPEDTENPVPASEIPEARDLPAEEISGSAPGGSPAVTVLAGLAGCIVGMILCAAGGGMTSTPGMFLFLLIPLAIGLANLLFRGSRGAAGLAVTAVFTALGVWFVPALTAAAAAVRKQGLTVFSVPLVALSRAGTANYFTDFAFDTPHVFPVLFAVIGVLTAWELYRRKKN